MSDITNPERYEYPLTENYSPEIIIELKTLTGYDKIVAILDTGFTGFLQVPLAIGLRANLTLWSTGNYILADGKSVKNLICAGTVRFAGKEIINLITLSETGDDCLLGMQFLEKIGMDFTVSPQKKKITFIDNSTKS